jgi:transposase
MTNVAVDIAKETFDAGFEVADKRKKGHFKNALSGWKDFQKWLKKHGVKEVHLFLEATGRYGELLARWAHGLGWKVTLLNPLRTRRFAESEGIYNKTDKIDTDCILDYSRSPRACRLRLWQPRSNAENELKEIHMELLGIEKMIGQERNRSKSCIATVLVKACIKKNIDHLKAQKQLLERRALQVIKSESKLQHDYKLLIQIKGIGEKSAIKILARVDFDKFTKGRQLVGFAGLAPRKWESGKSVRKKEMISRVGHADLRSALYFPAVVAMTHDAEMAEYKKHLENQGKPKKVIICAIMAKLLRKAFALIRDSKRQKPALAA